MRFQLGLFALFSALAFGALPKCDMSNEDCIEVATPTACYNQFAFRTVASMMTCVEGGKDAAAKKMCECWSCVGPQMGRFLQQNNLCPGGVPNAGPEISGGAGGGAAGGGAKGKGGKGGKGFGRAIRRGRFEKRDA